MLVCFKMCVKSALKKTLPGSVRAWLRCKQKECHEKRMRKRELYEIYAIQRGLDAKIRAMAKVKEGAIRVGFFVISSSSFQYENLLRLMVKDPLFAVSIVVIPDTLRGDENMRKTMVSAYEAFKIQYGTRVRLAHNGDYKFVDLSADFDVCFVTNPYDGMTHPLYRFENLARSGVLVAYTNYSYGEGTANAVNFNHMRSLQFLWRFYLDREAELVRMQHYQLVLHRFKRLSLVGSIKTDAFANVKVDKGVNKTIIIAPHHSVRGNATPLSMGTFDQYADFFSRLPVMYPQVHWIFRPHPLLFWTMRSVGLWNDSDEEDYISKITAYNNVSYVPEGDYHDFFVNSDALIQDSGSFIAEYHVVGHPQCYLLRDDTIERTQFNDFGREMLAQTYKAYSEQDIIDFIDNVVLAGNDPMKENRDKFAKEKLMYNYPHASEAIVADIKKALGRI